MRAVAKRTAATSTVATARGSETTTTQLFYADVTKNFYSYSNNEEMRASKKNWLNVTNVKPKIGKFFRKNLWTFVRKKNIFVFEAFLSLSVFLMRNILLCASKSTRTNGWKKCNVRIWSMWTVNVHRMAIIRETAHKQAALCTWNKIPFL